MLSRNTIKYIQSLHQKKFRQKYRNFIVEGEKMALEIIQSPSMVIEGIYALPDWIKENKKILNPLGSIIHPVNTKELDRISKLKTPNKVLCVCKILTYTVDSSLVNNNLTIYLDGIQDPGNMGSILRIADWFGIPYIFCSDTCVEIYNPKVIQSSMGAFLRVRSLVKDLEELKRESPNLPIFAAVLGGTNIFKLSPQKNGILVIGNEGNGISDATIALSDHQVTIPKSTKGGAESLNAAVATGILCSAFTLGKNRE